MQAKQHCIAMATLFESKWNLSGASYEIPLLLDASYAEPPLFSVKVITVCAIKADLLFVSWTWAFKVITGAVKSNVAANDKGGLESGEFIKRAFRNY